MNSHSLPGFDAWLTHNPLDDGPEPTVEDYEQAKEELGPEATNSQIDDRACEIMEKRIERARFEKEEAEADSINDDRDEIGDHPDY